MLAKNKNNVKRILLTGGGTGGSVSPLLAIAENFNDAEYVWIGTKNGPEKNMVTKEGIKFVSIYSGKLRRYFSYKNFIDPFLILLGFFQSLFILIKARPRIVISAGSFVSVPTVWAAWLLRIPSLIHQQDIRPGLANKLMAPFSRVITVTFNDSVKKYGDKAVWIGNPARSMEGSSTGAFQINKELPVVLIIGGGTGAVAINELIWERLDELTNFCQIIHVTGKGKTKKELTRNNYQSFEFLESSQISEAYAIANIIVSRAGMGTLTELSSLGKPSILIPIPNSHQEENANIFKENNAAIVLDQKELTPKKIANNIKQLLKNKDLQNKLHNNMQRVIKKGANENIVNIIKEIIK